MFSRNRTDSSNTTTSAADDSRATRRYAKAQCFAATARRERRLDFGSATRNSTPQATRTEPAWKLQKSWETRKKCDIPREKHGFAAEDKGFEPFSDTKENTGKTEVLKKRVINPTQGDAETLIELLDIIADSDAETLIELLQMAKQINAESQ